MKLPQTEVKFYPEFKSQTGLSSLRVSRKRALSLGLKLAQKKFFFHIWYRNLQNFSLNHAVQQFKTAKTLKANSVTVFLDTNFC